MYKKLYSMIFLFSIVLIIILPSSQGIYFQYHFQNQEGESVYNSKIKGYICKDTSCATISGSLWGGQILNTNDFVPHDRITLEFPATLQGAGYMVKVFNEEYKVRSRRSITLTDSHNSSTTFENPWYIPQVGASISRLNKQPDCSSPISLSVTGNISENIPLTITSSTNLDATTSGAIGEENYLNAPIEVEFYYEVETTLYLKIYEYDINTESNIGIPIHTQTKVERIYYDDNINVEFEDWTPPEARWYNVVVESVVTDPKCSSNIPLTASQQVRVWEDFPKDECYSLVKNLAASPLNPEVNQEVTLTFNKLSNYASEHDIWDTDYTLSPTPTKIKLEADGSKASETKLPANSDNEYDEVSIKWTPTEEGDFTLSIVAESVDYTCDKDTASNPVSVDITVSELPEYDLKFTVKKEYGIHKIKYATITVTNTNTQDVESGTTDNKGILEFELDKGSYSYTVEKTGYSKEEGTVELTSDNDKIIVLKYASCPGVDLENDADNCGSCNNVCDLTNANENCVEGICVISSCESNYYNNDNEPSNGCEYSCVKSSDIEDCTETSLIDEDCDGKINCIDSECSSESMCNINSCPDGYHNIDNNAVNGCEYACDKTSNTESSCTDGKDNNCNGEIDCDETSCYLGDWWDEIFDTNVCTCSKTNNGVETCDNIDNDCNGIVDDGITLSFCKDLMTNFSNYGVCKDQRATCVDGQPVCTDISEDEICDTLDNDCDNQIDEDCDIDQDGYINYNMTCINEFKDIGGITYSCEGHTNDCDDNKGSVHPGADELCDDIDNNCDGTNNEGCDCSEGDPIECNDKGVCSALSLTCDIDGIVPTCDYSSVHTYEKEETLCDGLDNDCDGNIDEAENCCNPSKTSKKECTKTCLDKTEVKGYKACSSYQWQECIAECPIEIIDQSTLSIQSPINDRTYYTCDDELSMALRYTYTGEEKCRYMFNSKASLVASEGKIIKAKLGTNTFSITCGEKETSVRFFLVEQKNCEKIMQNLTNETIELFLEEGFEESQIEAAEKLEDVVEEELEYSYTDEETIITNTITPSESLKGATYNLFIPKCLTEYLDDIEFDLKDYEVIKEDPLIAWHFAEIEDRVDLSYKVKGRIPKDCLEQIKGLTIADLIDVKESSGVKGMIIPGFIIVGVSGIAIYLQRFHPDVVKYSEEEYEKRGIEKARKMWLARIKQQRFSSKEQANNYMRNIELGEKDREWILSRL